MRVEITCFRCGYQTSYTEVGTQRYYRETPLDRARQGQLCPELRRRLQEGPVQGFECPNLVNPRSTRRLI